jgi:hypothetical protein
MAMADTQLTLGADATCTDGVCGELSRVVVDPAAWTVTHLVVEPKHQQGLGRLVPLDLVDLATGDVRLGCTLADFENLEHAEATEYLLESSGHVGVGLGTGVGIGDAPQPITHDTLPRGETAVRRGEHVHAVDGAIGRVHGLGIDADRKVTRVLLQEGHLWGRKEVAIPISALVAIDDGIRLGLTKQEVQDLPPVNIDRPDA